MLLPAVQKYQNTEGGPGLYSRRFGVPNSFDLMSGEAIISNLSHYHLSHIIFSNLYISSNYSEWPGTENMAINFTRYFPFLC